MEEIKIFENPELKAVTNNEGVIMPLVYRGEDGQALTTSLTVARVFCKEHKHVMEAIRSILSTTVEKSAFVGYQQLTKMFALTETERPMPVGGGIKKTPMFVMNRDGFTLLAMGFTGEKALAFKLEYIKAFNAMEQQIKQLATPSYQIEDPIKRAEKWIEEEKERQKLKEQIEEQKPKVEYFDKLVDRKLNTNFRDTAKEIGLKQNDFIGKLLDAKYIYRDTKGKIKPYAKYSEDLFIIKECASGDKWAGTQTLITPKGRETFGLLFGRSGDK